MGKLYLVRHGQASFGSSNYDCLSSLGFQQGEWLGNYFREREIQIDSVISGSMDRHQQTAESFLRGYGLTNTSSIATDARWNEFDFETLVKHFLSENPELMPKHHSPKSFFMVLRKALSDWSEGRLDEAMNESWEEFQSRVSTALSALPPNTSVGGKEALSQSGATIVFSSGGAIASAIAQVLRAPNSTLIDLNLQIRNTSVSELFLKAEQRYLCSFNAIPHLDVDGRQEAQTYA